MSPASIRAIPLIRGWMEDAGLSTWVDYMGNVHGRVEPKNGSSQALLIGSHMVGNSQFCFYYLLLCVILNEMIILTIVS
jgi:hypothetical protein